MLKQLLIAAIIVSCLVLTTMGIVSGIYMINNIYQAGFEKGVVGSKIVYLEEEIARLKAEKNSCFQRYYSNSVELYTSAGFSAIDNELLNNPDGQWANWAAASSSYGAEWGDAWSVASAIGLPDVFIYGDNPNAWAPLTKGGGIETLILRFSHSVYATEVNIKESYGSGAAIKVEFKDENGDFHKIWEGSDQTRGLGYLQVQVERASYKTNEVKITFDTTKVPDEWVEVDAVQLVGESE